MISYLLNFFEVISSHITNGIIEIVQKKFINPLLKRGFFTSNLFFYFLFEQKLI